MHRVREQKAILFPCKVLGSIGMETGMHIKKGRAMRRISKKGEVVISQSQITIRF